MRSHSTLGPTQSPSGHHELLEEADAGHAVSPRNLGCGFWALVALAHCGGATALGVCAARGGASGTVDVTPLFALAAFSTLFVGGLVQNLVLRRRANARLLAIGQAVEDAQDSVGAALKDFAASNGLQPIDGGGWQGAVDGLPIRARWMNSLDVPEMWRGGEVQADDFLEPSGWTVELQPACLSGSDAFIAPSRRLNAPASSAKFRPKEFAGTYSLWGDPADLARLLTGAGRQSLGALTDLDARVLGPSVVLDSVLLARTPHVAALLRDAAAAARALQTAQAGDQVPRLVAALAGDGSVEIRAAAALALADEQLTRPEAAAALLKAMDDAAPCVAFAAMLMYEGRDDAPLIRAATDDRRGAPFRSVAIWRLVERGARGPEVERAARSCWTRSSALERVAAFKLAGALALPDFDAWLASLADSLPALPCGSADEPLVPQVAWIRHARTAPGRFPYDPLCVPPLGPQHLPRALRRLLGGTREARIEQRKGEQGAAFVERVDRARSRLYLEAALADAIEKHATRRHVAALLGAVCHPSPLVRSAALDALGRVGTLAEVAPLLEALRGAPRDHDDLDDDGVTEVSLGDGFIRSNLPSMVVPLSFSDEEREHGRRVVALLQAKYGGSGAGAVAVVDAAPAGSVAVAPTSSPTDAARAPAVAGRTETRDAP